MKVPLVLRTVAGGPKWNLIGDCYVHGIMHGEGFNKGRLTDIGLCYIPDKIGHISKVFSLLYESIQTSLAAPNPLAYELFETALALLSRQPQRHITLTSKSRSPTGDFFFRREIEGGNQLSNRKRV